MDFGAPHDEERDWSQLVPDILNLVSKNLPDLCDFIHFRAVCKPWLSVSPLTDPPSQLPWILSRSSCFNNYLCFYSLSSKKFHTICVDESRGKELIGPAQNYIFSIDSNHSSPTYLNPLARKHVILPPVNLDWCFPVSNSRDCVAICGGQIESEYQTLSFWRPGDRKWIEIQKPLEGCLIVYHEGAYFVYHAAKGETEVIDVMTDDVLSVICAPPTKLNYLVESSGELLGISCDPDQNGCEIYRLDRVNKNLSWVKMSDIGDRMLFLHGGQGFSVRAHESNRLEGNCIYHLGHHESVKVHGTCTTYHLFRYKIGERSWEELPLPLMEEPTWFLPSLM
ncbi:hypothetical protein LUZ60_015062 [Juncus effusus]|nr:hypothetical protein LUZ60_015062 [Juncus effusus]